MRQSVMRLFQVSMLLILFPSLSAQRGWTPETYRDFKVNQPVKSIIRLRSQLLDSGVLEKFPGDTTYFDSIGRAYLFHDTRGEGWKFQFEKTYSLKHKFTHNVPSGLEWMGYPQSPYLLEIFHLPKNIQIHSKF